MLVKYTWKTHKNDYLFCMRLKSLITEIEKRVSDETELIEKSFIRMGMSTYWDILSKYNAKSEEDLSIQDLKDYVTRNKYHDIFVLDKEYHANNFWDSIVFKIDENGKLIVLSSNPDSS